MPHLFHVSTGPAPFSNGFTFSLYSFWYLSTYCNHCCCLWHPSTDLSPAGLQLFYLHLEWCCCIPPKLPVSNCTFCLLPFCVQVLPGAACSSMQASWHFCLTSCSLGWTVLELRRNDPGQSISFLGPLFPLGSHPLGLFQADPWRGQSSDLLCLFH